MNLYLLLFISSIILFCFIYYLKSGVRKKYFQKAWIERLETIARDNHILWATHLPYSQKDKICTELTILEKEQSEEGFFLKISEEGEWSSPSDLLKHPSVKRLFQKLIPHIMAYSRTLGLDPKFLTLSAWANISRSKRTIPKHAQEDALFSGCYFLKGNLNPSENAGGLSFYKKQAKGSLLALFNPQPGDLLLYPSDMYQKQAAYKGQEEQISIAFDVHFGNRKKSWLISKVIASETSKKTDPFHEMNSDLNAPKHLKNSENKTMLFHTSQIKK